MDPDIKGSQTALIEAAVAFAAFCGLSGLSRLFPVVFLLTTLSGVLTLLAMGLGFGFIFQRTGNIVAPWLAHALMGIAAVAVGGMTFIQYTPSPGSIQ